MDEGEDEADDGKDEEDEQQSPPDLHAHSGHAACACRVGDDGYDKEHDCECDQGHMKLLFEGGDPRGMRRATGVPWDCMSIRWARRAGWWARLRFRRRGDRCGRGCG